MSKPSRKAKLGRVIRLHVIPEPAPGTRSVLLFQGDGTVVITTKGGSSTTLACGKCGAPLALAPVTQIRGMVLRCNRCNSYNETPA